MTASFSSSMPPTGVYLVKPSSMARMAAALMLSGVSKSGSPAPKPMMSLPSFCRALAFIVTASVGDGLRTFVRGPSFISFTLS